MYNQTEAILSQYEIKIQDIVKGRGAYICETEQGMKMLVPFRGSKEKGTFLKTYLEVVSLQGFPVEQIMWNKNLEVVTEDEVTGERFILKDYVAGSELNTGRIEDIKAAADLLGEYHKTARKIAMEIPEIFQKNVSDMVESKRRHHREIIKVKNYIRGRKKKNEFEKIFMGSYQNMLEAGEESLAILEGQEMENCIFCHGDFNQHNVLWTKRGLCIVNFENFCYGWSMLDFANYLRKMMEKHNWDIQLGMMVVAEYDKACPMTKEQYKQLYGLILFPEKFWKVINHYMNSRKTWISERDIDKLKKVIEQENQRRKFLENLFSFLE